MVTRIVLFTWAATWCAAATLSAARADEPRWEAIFDGRSLQGWEGQDMSFWSVEDGAITGTISPEHRPTMNQYLVYQRAQVADFELELEFRLTGSTTADTNGGFQFRSRRLPNGDVAGYQVDNNFGQPWRARIYDEFGRHNLALEGQQTVFSPRGEQSVESFAISPDLASFRLDEWHRYTLLAVGPRLVLSVNGHRIAETLDGDADSYEARGILAMQLHTGPPMKAQFRALRLRNLSSESSAHDRLWADAALAWDLGERMTAHQPPLDAVGAVKVEQSGAVAGAPASRVARFAGGHVHAQVDLNQPRLWNCVGEGQTVFVRAQLDKIDVRSVLFSKGTLDAAPNFWLGIELSDELPEMVYAVRIGQRVAQARVRLSEVGAAAWHNWVGRYDGLAIELRCDGRRLAREEAPGEVVPNDAPILIGAEADSDTPGPGFTGQIERVGLWTRALSDGELSMIPAGE